MTENARPSICPGCALALARTGGETHAYLGASPECWALFGEVLAREFSAPSYFAVHGLTVDAYAAQHPGAEEPRTLQSIHVHLVGLCLALERDAPMSALIAVRKRVADKFAARLDWPVPPADPDRLTVRDVVAATSAQDHGVRVRAWAESVWASWSAHHDRVRSLADAAAG